MNAVNIVCCCEKRNASMILGILGPQIRTSRMPCDFPWSTYVGPCSDSLEFCLAKIPILIADKMFPSVAQLSIFCVTRSLVVHYTSLLSACKFIKGMPTVIPSSTFH